MQLLAAQDFTYNPRALNRLRTNSRYPHETKEFWGEGEGVPRIRTHFLKWVDRIPPLTPAPKGG